MTIKFRWFNSLILGALLLFGAGAMAQAPQFASGERQTSLIELYSSEGCSSCPPADRWVAGLKEHGKLWREFIPLNFHVDYWNRLGWVDRFSNIQFTRRQRRFAAEWGSNRVYTPGFVRNGQEWRRRTMSGLLGQSVGKLEAHPLGNGKYKVQFHANLKDKSHYTVHVALLGHGLSTEVKYGENAGEILHHEFVVLKTTKKGMQKIGNLYQADVALPSNKMTGPKRFSVAFWVSAPGSQRPIQATGGYL